MWIGYHSKDDILCGSGIRDRRRCVPKPVEPERVRLRPVQIGDYERMFPVRESRGDEEGDIVIRARERRSVDPGPVVLPVNQEGDGGVSVDPYVSSAAHGRDKCSCKWMCSVRSKENRRNIGWSPENFSVTVIPSRFAVDRVSSYAEGASL